MAISKKITKPVVRFDHTPYVFESITQAADAIKFFGKLKRANFVENPSDGRYYYMPSDTASSIELETDRGWLDAPKRIALPAPKRGTVPCAVCESVSVKPGSACDSCGTVAPLL